MQSSSTDQDAAVAQAQPRAQSTISYNDAGVPTKIDFDYDQYGNITNKREYGHQIGGTWKVRRRTRYTYKTDQTYLDAFLRSLITLKEILDVKENTNDADDVVISKMAYIFDNYTVMGGMESYGHTSPPVWPLHHDPLYNTSRTVRGNLTGTTEWSDIVGNVSITRNKKYDIFGNIVKEEVSCCQEKSYEYTESMYWSKVEESTRGVSGGTQLTESAEYDFNTSMAESQTNASNLTLSFNYDTALRSTGRTLYTGAASSITYNDQSPSSEATINYDDGGTMRSTTTSTHLDGWSRVTHNIGANGAQVNTTYNAMGRVIGTTNPFQSGGQPGPSTTYEYDALGRQKIITSPDGNTVQMLYSGTTVTSIDQVNRKIRRENDGLGRLVKVVEQDAAGALTQETNYKYDLLGNLIEVNQGNQIRKFKYDALGRLIFERIPEQTATINDGTGVMWSCKYTYTEFGAAATRTDARGVITTYSYDNLHRPTNIAYNTSNATGVATTRPVKFNYSGDHVSSIQVGDSGVVETYTESYTYDTFGRLSQITQSITGGNQPNLSLTFTYNEANQVKQLTYPGATVNQTYNAIGQLIELKDQQNNSYVSITGFNLNGQVTSNTLGNGVAETYTYDSQRLQRLTQTTQIGSTTLMSLTYGYQGTAGNMGAGTLAGNADQLITINGMIGGQTEKANYSYDNLGRLVTSKQTTNGQQQDRRFNYDRWGNRTAAWDATQGGNQIQSVTLLPSIGVTNNKLQSVTTNGQTFSYQHDAAGNVTNDGQHSYQYDAENRVVKIDNGATEEYSYDHQNRRYKKVQGGVTTRYLWQGGQVLAEVDNANGGSWLTKVSYIYGESRLVARLNQAYTWQCTTNSKGEQECAWVSSSTKNYFLSDNLSIRLILDSNGNITARQSHLPFGESVVSSVQEKRRFTTYDRDSESGLDYAINRYNAPHLGRFITVDPLKSSARPETPQTWNRYSYTWNDPVNMTDPFGLASFSGYGGKSWLMALLSNPCSPGGGGPTIIYDGFELSSTTNCTARIPFPSTDAIVGAFLEPLFALFPGLLSVESSCQRAIYVPEDNKDSDPAKAFKDAVGITNAECDFVSTPRGSVKIPDGCACGVKCSGGGRLQDHLRLP